MRVNGSVCVEKFKPAAYERRCRSVREHALWISTINPTNAFETLSSILSALHLTLESGKEQVTWRPLTRGGGALGWAGDVRQLTKSFLACEWRAGETVGECPRSRRDIGPRCTCFAGARHAGSFDLMSSFGSARGMAAVRALRSAAFRWAKVPPPLGLTQQAGPEAVLLQRGGGRTVRWARRERFIINTNAVLGALRGAAFAPSVVVVEDVPLAGLLAAMRRAALLVVVHGAGMVNQIFMRHRAAVIEAFPPKFLYGTGIEHIIA